MTKYRIHAIFLPTGKVFQLICDPGRKEALEQNTHWDIFLIDEINWEE